jgi:hypothetical protein
MAHRLVPTVRKLAFCVVLLLAFSVRSEASHFGQNDVQTVNIIIIDNNQDLVKIHKTPSNERGMTDTAFKTYVLNYIKKYEIKYRRLRFIKCITMLQREAIECAVIYV